MCFDECVTQFIEEFKNVNLQKRKIYKNKFFCNFPPRHSTLIEQKRSCSEIVIETERVLRYSMSTGLMNGGFANRQL